MKRSYARFLILIVFFNCLLYLATAQVEPPELKKPLQQRPEFVRINASGYAGEAIVWHDHSFIGAEDFEFAVLDTGVATISEVNRRELNTTIEFIPHKIGVTTFVITASNAAGSVSLSRPLYVYESLTPLYNSLRSYGDIESLRIPAGYSRTIWFKDEGYLQKLREESADEQFDPFEARFELKDCETWTKYYKGCPFTQVIASGSNGAYFEIVAMEVGETFFISDYGNISVSTYKPNPDLSSPSVKKVIPDLVISVNKSQLLPLGQYFEGEELMYSTQSIPFGNPQGFDIRIVDFNGDRVLRLDAGSEWIWPTEVIVMAKNTSGSISQTFNVTVRGDEETTGETLEEGTKPEMPVSQMFEITLTNLTTGEPGMGGQILSPPFFVTHPAGINFAPVGDAASPALVALAESGDTSALVAFATSAGLQSMVADSMVASGGAVTVTVTADMVNSSISIGSMLVSTNDAFIAATDVALFDEAGMPVSMSLDLIAYDAGSEDNTELASDIPGPLGLDAVVDPKGSNERVPTEGGVITPHEGIQGVGDVSAVFAWKEPTAMLTITPIEVLAEPVADSYPAEDVNEDGQTNIADLMLILADFGKTPIVNPRADVNEDGAVDWRDLLLVIANLDESADAAISVINSEFIGLDRGQIQAQIDLLLAMGDNSLAAQKAFEFLQHLLGAIRPNETRLLPNYPNPFNPETWIPYQLAEPANVTISIYSADGRLVRTLELGPQLVGIYEFRSRAAYWDGKNDLGESVASGVYFYTLTADDFTATRKMLIRR